jgi:phosphate transport system protein
MLEHTDRDFAQELKTLRERLTTMAERAAAQIALAMRALTDKRDELAHEVIKGDSAIDSDENDIDRLAMQILATRQPVASDLRFLTMALKFVVDVERIGDLAAGIAKRALELNRLPPWSRAAIWAAWPRWCSGTCTWPSTASCARTRMKSPTSSRPTSRSIT